MMPVIPTNVLTLPQIPWLSIVGPRNCVLHGVNTGVTWRIQLNDQWSAAMLEGIRRCAYSRPSRGGIPGRVKLFGTCLGAKRRRGDVRQAYTQRLSIDAVGLAAASAQSGSLVLGLLLTRWTRGQTLNDHANFTVDFYTTPIGFLLLILALIRCCSRSGVCVSLCSQNKESNQTTVTRYLAKWFTLTAIIYHLSPHRAQWHYNNLRSQHVLYVVGQRGVQCLVKCHSRRLSEGKRISFRAVKSPTTHRHHHQLTKKAT